MAGLLKGDVTPTSYEYDEWRLRENSVQQARLPQSDALFSVGNGFIGLRGVSEEFGQDADSARPCIFLNGVYEKVRIDYYEKAAGFAEYSDSRLPVADAAKVQLQFDDEVFSLADGRVDSYERWLDYRTGLVHRKISWTSPQGKQVALHFERFASLHCVELLLQRVSITALNFSGHVGIRSQLDARFGNGAAFDESSPATHDPRLGPALDHNPFAALATIDEDDIAGFVHRLEGSEFNLASASRHQFSAHVERRRSIDAFLVEEQFDGALEQGVPFVVEKISAYRASRHENGESLACGLKTQLLSSEENRFNALLAQQHILLQRFWQSADLNIDGKAALTSTLKFNMLQLFLAVGRDGKRSISAKGQTGEGYEGHFFWDAEILCLPFFAFNQPELARQMLCYRHRHLDQARDVARNMGHSRGALFPWRTISGYECSAYFPAGSAQYHINADIAYAVKLYHRASGDEDFIEKAGAEIVWESARIWLQVGFFNPRHHHQFVINDVTGPDEYTAIVNNNFYTNVMAKAHLEYAVALFHQYRHLPLVDGLSLREDEVQQWQRAADAMYLPYDEVLGIHKQDDSFLDKEKWDFANTPAEQYPLLLHYHPLTIYRYQVSKQADTVLADFLEGQRFTAEVKLRDYEYYKQVCVHDSTLSPCVYSIIACELNKLAEAGDMFNKTVFIDVENLHQNSDHGLHMAAMGGSWMALVFGFGGMRLHNEILSFHPRLPVDWPHYHFSVSYRGRVIQVHVTQDQVEYTLLSGQAVRVRHTDEELLLVPDKTMTRPLPE